MKHYTSKFKEEHPNEYHSSFNFINQCSFLGPVQQKIINYMVGSDYDMNGIVRWTREKYHKDTGASYNAVCKCFKLLVDNSILVPIPGTSNYSFDFGLLQRRCRLNNWQKPVSITTNNRKKLTSSVSNTDICDSNTDICDSKTDIGDSKTNTECQHIDNIDLIDKIDLYREEQDSSSPFKGEESRPSTTTKPPITKDDIADFARQLSIETKTNQLI